MDLAELIEYIVNGNADDAEAFTVEALAAGLEPGDIVNNGLIPGMDIVGDKFQNREYFMPEMLVSARAMKRAMVHIKPLLSSSDQATGLRAVCGTVTGDLHDIGISLVGMMLEGAGFEVIYLGPDNTADQFLDAVKEEKAQVLCMSALLTTTIKNMGSVVQRANELGVRDRVKIYVGGAPVTEKFSNDIGADGYRPDAGSAVKMIKEDLE
ncbi:MAG: corrinoid protein [SAR202 cluster bacterium]|jgi:methanogenic corrinoid protein MtbC1|nr:corrinoid protein [SAR202 cluster bacterium]|tara:strand:- start:1325 stop:1954 length:630 start_codon:yes stop_codon:yes gene_type:complete